MSKYYIEYRQKYFSEMSKEYEKSNRIERRKLKDKLYSNIHLTEAQKDAIWTDLMKIHLKIK